MELTPSVTSNVRLFDSSWFKIANIIKLDDRKTFANSTLVGVGSSLEKFCSIVIRFLFRNE